MVDGDVAPARLYLERALEILEQLIGSLSPRCYLGLLFGFELDHGLSVDVRYRFT